MCTVLLAPGVNPIAVNKYIIYYNSSVTQKMEAAQFFFVEMSLPADSYTLCENM